MEKALVFDVGSSSTKMGYAGDDIPRHVLHTFVGRDRYRGVMMGTMQRDAYVGEEALSKWAMLRLTYPIERGIVTNWDDYEKVIHHSVYNELRIAPEEYPVLFARDLKMEKAAMERLAQISFETFAILAHSSGRAGNINT